MVPRGIRLRGWGRVGERGVLVTLLGDTAGVILATVGSWTRHFR